MVIHGKVAPFRYIPLSLDISHTVVIAVLSSKRKKESSVDSTFTH